MPLAVPSSHGLAQVEHCPGATPLGAELLVRMTTLAEALTALGWSAFALDALSDESDSELATMLADMGREATSVAELRGVIADAAAGASRAQRLLGFLARTMAIVFVQAATLASP